MRREGEAQAGRRWSVGPIASNVVVVATLLLAASQLPPDTSLRLIEERGSLRVCVPTTYPPLVYGSGSAQPGIDVELVREIGSRLGLRVQLAPNSAIGKDFNPRNWRITRAQCEVIAGGVVASVTTRSFLQTTQPHLETGWAVVFADGERALTGARVAFYAGTSGLDRIALSRALRAAGSEVRIASSVDELERLLASGEVDAAVTESLLARQIAYDGDYQAAWLPGLERSPLALGLWKGDLTLLRAVERVMDDMRRDGTLDALLARYELQELEACEACLPREGSDPAAVVPAPKPGDGARRLS